MGFCYTEHFLACDLQPYYVCIINHYQDRFTYVNIVWVWSFCKGIYVKIMIDDWTVSNQQRRLLFYLGFLWKNLMSLHLRVRIFVWPSKVEGAHSLGIILNVPALDCPHKIILRVYKWVHLVVISRGEVTVNETSASEKHPVQSALNGLKDFMHHCINR